MLARILKKLSITESPHADGEGLNAEHNNISKLVYAPVFFLDRNLKNTYCTAPEKV